MGTQRTSLDGTVGTTVMRAAVARRFGGPDVVSIETVPRPVPGADEVLVRLRATTVSIADHRIRAKDLPRGLGFFAVTALGVFRPRKQVLGMEGAGVVTAVGADVTRFRPGDRVVVMRGAAMGCHAEYATVREDAAIVRIAEGMSFDDAAALVFGGYTAVSYLARVELGEGTDVLVNGASGAVGTAVVQLAHAAGARVTGVTSARNRDLMLGLGADDVIAYDEEDFTEDSRRYDVVVECVGNAPFERARTVMKPRGALLLVIADLRGMLLAGLRSRRTGMLVTSSGSEFGAATLERVVELAESGALRPVVDRTYDLDDIVEAHRYVDTGRKRGSVVVRIP